MTDNAVTDDDRRNARLWAEKVDPPHTNPGYSGTPSDIHNAARVILATVPAPKTIAEELLNPDSYDEDTDGPYVVFDQARMMRIVKRAEAVERDNISVNAALRTVTAERNEARNEIADLTAEREKARDERDKACAAEKKAKRSHAEFLYYSAGQFDPKLAAERDDHGEEVKRLRTELEKARAEAERLKDRVDYLKNGDWLSDDPTDPADVPKGEPYLVGVEGEDNRLLGLRNSGEPHPWETFSLATLGSGGWCSDTDITLVARLVPDVRRVIDKAEDLDKLPVGSVVLDEDGFPIYKMTRPFWRSYQEAPELNAAAVINTYGPVTVVYEPEEDE